MRRRGANATDHAEVADDAPCCAVCRDREAPCECEWADEYELRAQMKKLGRNLRDAAGCAVAWGYSANYARDLLMRQRFDQWRPNCNGQPAPGWER
jgi:hypothetical protein